MMDNLRLSDYSGEIVFDNLGIVMQDNYFINDTVRNNLKLVKYNIKDQEMLEVCKKVNTFILKTEQKNRQKRNKKLV